MCAWVRKVAARVVCGGGKFEMRCLAWTLSGFLCPGGQLQGRGMLGATWSFYEAGVYCCNADGIL